jgi:hypothetical protein
MVCRNRKYLIGSRAIVGDGRTMNVEILGKMRIKYEENHPKDTSRVLHLKKHVGDSYLRHKMLGKRYGEYHNLKRRKNTDFESSGNEIWITKRKDEIKQGGKNFLNLL